MFVVIVTGWEDATRERNSSQRPDLTAVRRIRPVCKAVGSTIAVGRPPDVDGLEGASGHEGSISVT